MVSLRLVSTLLLSFKALCHCTIKYFVLICVNIYVYLTFYVFAFVAAVTCSCRRFSFTGSFSHPQCRQLLHEHVFFHPALWRFPWEIKWRHHGKKPKIHIFCFWHYIKKKCKSFFALLSQIADQKLIIPLKGITVNCLQYVFSMILVWVV